jgi:hypothetical protein
MKTIRELFDTLPYELQNLIYEYNVEHRPNMNKVFDELYVHFGFDKYYLDHCYHCNHILNDKYTLLFINSIRYKYCMGQHCIVNRGKQRNIWLSRLQN